MTALRRKEDVALARDIEIVGSALKAGLNHLGGGNSEWTGAICYDRNI